MENALTVSLMRGGLSSIVKPLKSAVLSVATALPSYLAEQSSIAKFLAKKLQLKPKEEKQFCRLFQNTSIDARSSVIGDFLEHVSASSLYSHHFPSTLPGTKKRNEIYKKEAPILAFDAAKKALDLWGGSYGAITHVISVSCTGVLVPGIEFLLIDELKLSRQAKRLGINFMGCFGAFQGLDVAKAFALEDPKNRVLLVCTELCSLHMQAEKSMEAWISSALFADGSAAVVVGAEPRPGENPIWEIEKRRSYALENSLEEMGWDLGDDGCSMRLTNRVAKEIKTHIKSFADDLIGNKASIDACEWMVHPGGKAILEAVEEGLNMPKKERLASSWEVLRRHGNMSSATFLFILEQARRKKWGAGIGFGPGLSIEGILLKNAQA